MDGPAVEELEQFLTAVRSEDEDEALDALSSGTELTVGNGRWTVYCDPVDGWSAYGVRDDPEDLENPHAERELHLADPATSPESVVAALRRAMVEAA